MPDPVYMTDRDLQDSAELVIKEMRRRGFYITPTDDEVESFLRLREESSRTKAEWEAEDVPSR
jgi:hypothetical protein